MKKTVIIILAILPIVLVIAIAFAGRIFSIYRHVPVERVSFVNAEGKDVGLDYTFTVNVGETKQSNIRVYPDLASNKAVTYTSSDESVCTVDKDGKITGVELGTTAIMVKTYDGSKTSLMTVKVTADNVTGVSLDQTELSLSVGASHTLTATVTPYAALNKGVTFTTDNTGVVSVSANGKVVALSPGTANVTVTTLDGGYTATCLVTVSDTVPPIHFDFSGASGITEGGVGYIVSLDFIDLKAYMELDESIAVSDVKFEIVSGSYIASINDGVITFTSSGIVVVAVYTGDASAPANRIEIRMLHP